MEQIRMDSAWVSVKICDRFLVMRRSTGCYPFFQVWVMAAPFQLALLTRILNNHLLLQDWIHHLKTLKTINFRQSHWESPRATFLLILSLGQRAAQTREKANLVWAILHWPWRMRLNSSNKIHSYFMKVPMLLLDGSVFPQEGTISQPFPFPLAGYA